MSDEIEVAFCEDVAARFRGAPDGSFVSHHGWLTAHGVTFYDVRELAVSKLDHSVNYLLSSFTEDELSEAWDALDIADDASRVCWMLTAKVTDLPLDDASYLASVMTWNTYIDSIWNGKDARGLIPLLKSGEIDPSLAASLVLS